MKYQALRENDAIAIELLRVIFTTRERKDKYDKKLVQAVREARKQGMKNIEIQEKFNISSYKLNKIFHYM